MIGYRQLFCPSCGKPQGTIREEGFRALLLWRALCSTCAKGLVLDDDAAEPTPHKAPPRVRIKET